MDYLELEEKVSESVAEIEWIRGAGKRSRERMFADSVEEKYSQELVSIWFVREIIRRIGDQDAEVYFNDIESLITDSANLEDLFHPMMNAPLGTILALLALPENVFTGDHFSASGNALVRATAAAISRDSEMLDYLSYDTCMVVRTIVAVNDMTERSTKDRLASDPFFDVRRRTLYGDSEAIESFDTKLRAVFNDQAESEFVDWRAFACSCSANENNLSVQVREALAAGEQDFYELFVEEKELFVPNLPSGLSNRLREFDNSHWATQPFPAPSEDYLFKIDSYLRGVIPDQYSISHWGHGVNSYSLNFRFAMEELVILGQVAWFGAYNDAESCVQAWNEMAQYMDGIIQMKPRLFSEKPRQRDVLILFSDFRGSESGIWERDGARETGSPGWSKIPESETLKDMVRIMRARV